MFITVIPLRAAITTLAGTVTSVVQVYLDISFSAYRYASSLDLTSRPHT